MFTKVAYHILQLKAKKNTKQRSIKTAIFAYDDIGHLINLEGYYELKYLDLLRKFLDEKKINNELFLDIGANIGNHTLYFQNYFDSIIGVEASKETFELLKFNTKSFDNIKVINIGASSSRRKLKFKNNNFNVGASRIVEDHMDYDFSINVDKLDNIIDSDRKVDLIKIDVVGHELEALMGGSGILQNSKPVGVFEQETTQIKHGTSEVIKFLKSVGYQKFYAIQHKTDVTFIQNRYLKTIANYLLRNKLVCVPVESFKKKLYNMIIAYH